MYGMICKELMSGGRAVSLNSWCMLFTPHNITLIPSNKEMPLESEWQQLA